MPNCPNCDGFNPQGASVCKYCSLPLDGVAGALARRMRDTLRKRKERDLVAESLSTWSLFYLLVGFLVAGLLVLVAVAVESRPRCIYWAAGVLALAHVLRVLFAWAAEVLLCLGRIEDREGDKS